MFAKLPLARPTAARPALLLLALALVVGAVLALAAPAGADAPGGSVGPPRAVAQGGAPSDRGTVEVA